MNPIDNADQFLNIPDESKTWKYTLQGHIRGRSAHCDLRLENSDKFLVGWTLFIPKGLSKDPANFEEAKSMFKKEIEPIVLDKFQNPDTKWLATKKAVQPIEWMTQEGKVEKGGVGATKNEYGYFVILEQGTVEYGSQRAQHHEYFFHGKIVNGKITFRELENKGEWKEAGDEIFTWMAFPSLNPPYVITTRSIKHKYDSKDKSALPKAIRDKIPKELRYWEISDATKRIETRIELIKILRKQPISTQKALLTNYSGAAFRITTLDDCNSFAIESDGYLLCMDNDVKDLAIDAVVLTSKKDNLKIKSPVYSGLTMSKSSIFKLGSIYIKSFQTNDSPHAYGYKMLINGLTVLYAPSIKEIKDNRMLQGVDLLCLNTLDIETALSYKRSISNAESMIKLALQNNIENVLIMNNPDKISNEKLTTWLERATQGKMTHIIAVPNETIEFWNDINMELAVSKEKRYVLQHRWWKGPVVIRVGPSKRYFDLRIEDTPKKYHHFILNNNPISTESVSGKYQSDSNYEMFGYVGLLPPSHPENGTKETPAWIDRLTKGYVTILEDNPNVKQFMFESGEMTGSYMAYRTAEGGDTWILDKKSSISNKNLIFDFKKSKQTSKDTWEVTGFAVGKWNGLFYSEEVLANAPKPDGINVVRDHSEKVADQLGKVIGSRWSPEDKIMYITIKITNKEARDQVANKLIQGVSMRVLADTEMDGDGEKASKILGWVHASLVMEPGVDVCTFE